MCIEFQRPTALKRRNVLEWSGWSPREDGSPSRASTIQHYATFSYALLKNGSLASAARCLKNQDLPFEAGRFPPFEADSSV